MRKLCALLLLSLCLTATVAQPVTAPSDRKASGEAFQFGYFSENAVLKSMPDYTVARHSLDELRAKYDAEMKRVGDEFNAKYELFLQGQQDFAPSIREKRQAELVGLMEKNTAFKAKAQQLLKDAEAEAMRPLREKLAAAILRVGRAKGLAFILNTDDSPLPYVNPAYGEDVAEDIKAAL